jgi:hypothetical protein
MGFLDKVKEQAEKAKVQAQDLKGKVGEKVEEVQAKRKADDLLAELGRFLYAERTGRSLPGAEADIERLVTELKTLEDEGTVILATGSTAPGPAAVVPEPEASAVVVPEPEAPAAVAPEADAPVAAEAPEPPA